MADIRQVTIKVRDRQVDGGVVPSTAVMAEPFVNLYNGVLRFSGVTGGDYETSSQAGVFEVGSKLYNSQITNRLNVGDNFVISGGTGIISEYAGITGAGLSGKFMSGTTSGFVLGDISDIQGVTTRVQNGTNTLTGGTPDNPTVNLVDSPSINGLTASGTSNFTGVIQSGGTDLYTIFLTSGDLSGTSVSAGANVDVNQVGSDYEVSVVDSPSFNDIAFSGTATGGDAIFGNMSASTLYSGSTDMETIIYNIAEEAAGTHTYVQPGTNILTGGTSTEPIVSTVDSPSFNDIMFSGTATGGDMVVDTLSAITSISATTMFSGGTDLETIIENIAGDISGTHTYVQPGTNILTGGTALAPIISTIDSPSFNNIDFSGTTTGGDIVVGGMSATTIFSAGTDLETIIENIAGNGDVTRVQAGTNITTGGTANFPIINTVDSPSFNDIAFSGTATGGNASFADMSATTLYSGSTNLEDIISTVAGEHTAVQGGTNIVTGGTASAPTISLVDSPSVDVLSASGHMITNGTTYSGGTIVDDGIFTLDAATRVEVDSDLLPTAHLTYDLGQPGQRWDELYVRKVRLGTSSTTLEDQLFSSTTGDFKFDFAGDLYINNNTYPENDIAYDMGRAVNRWKTGYFQDVDMLGDLSATALTVSNLTEGRVVYVGTGGKLIDEAGFEYDETADLFKTANLQVGTPGTTGTTTTIFGDLVVIGEGISGFTSELYIEDNLIELNYNPTASTISTSLGAGWSIQDGSGIGGTDVLFDIRGTSTGLADRSFSTNLGNIRVGESGTIGAPNGLYLIKETDCIDGGTY